MPVNRRDFLRKAASVSAAALAASLPDSNTQLHAEPLPSADRSGIEHVIVVMMENRSFDHFLGWMPNANGRQSGLSYPDHNGVMHPTHRLNYFVGCSHPDPDHSYAGGRSEYNEGKMNGWLRTSTNDSFCIGYYAEGDLPLFSTLARNFTTCSHYFASILSSTFPNRVFQHSAQTDRLSNTLTVSTLPTIWDRLQDAKVSNRYYYSNVPFLALWGEKYIPISAMYEQFKTDVALGTLPAVSFIDPWLTILDTGDGNDDHPHADLRKGEIFLRDIVETVAKSPYWKNTVIVINRDEWGGFFDHVAPPRVIAPNSVDTDLKDGKALLGCRVPTVIVSPYARGNPAKPRINSLLFDHTSVLKLIEWRWNLAPLTSRDASSEVANLALALQLPDGDHDSDDKANYTVPALPVIPDPGLHPCVFDTFETLNATTGLPLINVPQATAVSQHENSTGADEEIYDFFLMLQSDLMKGWPLPPQVQALRQ